MKNLIYKELKLSLHPLIYLLILLMSLYSLTPGAPTFVSILYISIIYTIMFIGANKGTTTNDLLYSVNLPIKRSDIVKARLLSVGFVQLLYTILMYLFLFISLKTAEFNPEETILTVGINQGIAYLGIVLICYSVFDIIYLPWFYKTGKTVIANMFTGMIVIAIVAAALTIIPAKFQTCMDVLTVGGESANYIIQFAILLSGILVYVGSRILIIKISTKRLIALDF